MTDNGIREAIKVLRLCEAHEINAGKAAILQDLLDEAEALLALKKVYPPLGWSVRLREEIEHDISMALMLQVAKVLPMMK